MTRVSKWMEPVLAGVDAADRCVSVIGITLFLGGPAQGIQAAI